MDFPIEIGKILAESNSRDMSAHSSYGVIRGPIDLTGCDQEPVHRIGAIQNHGALLVFDRESERLVESSLSWQRFFPHCESENKDLDLESLFDADMLTELRGIAAADRQTLLPTTLTGGEEVLAHRVGTRLVVEIESLTAASQFDPVAGMNSILSSVAQAQTSSAYLAALAEKLQETLGVHRVMIYRFHPDWTGEVVAEAARGDRRYLGLRFPASDIPQPAREVFQRVWVRHIADVEQPSLPVTRPSGDACSFDMTQVGLRASSPIHLEYLKNMGVGASLTCSLRINDRLWGLVAVHHEGPFLLRPSARAGLEVLSQMVSFRLAQLLQSESQAAREECESVVLAMVERWETAQGIALSDDLEVLAALMDCDATAIFEDGQWYRRDGMPVGDLNRFREWLVNEKLGEEAPLFHSAALPRGLVPGFLGALAVAPSGPEGSLVCWFRREQAQTVRWAGDPGEKASPSPTERLHPRSSFAEYVEITKNRALPWSDLDVWKAQLFLETFRKVAFRFQLRLEQRNQALTRSNLALDTFAYMASHDLKEPLRGIANYATFLKEDYGKALSGDGITYLNGLQNLAERMTELLDALLTYSRLDHQKIDPMDCDLDVLARQTCELLSLTRGAEVLIPKTLPVVHAYRPFLAEILMNLLTNAIKYTDEATRRIEIGALEDSPEGCTFYVKDNGIGIPEEHQDYVFHLFRRLHGEAARGGGSGVGLTIVKKMVERHGGTVRLESEPGQGSCFYVFLPTFPHRSSAESAEK